MLQISNYPMTASLFRSCCLLVYYLGVHVGISGYEIHDASLDVRPLESSKKLRSLKSRIVGGTIADATRHSYFTFITVLDDRGRPFARCGGSLIAPDVVLTAAHCVYGRGGTGNGTIQALVNQTVLFEKTGYEFERTSRFYLVHPKYDPKVFVNHDIALVFLKDPVKGVPLLKINAEASLPSAGQSNLIVGLGWTNSSPVTFAKNLMQAPLNVLSFQTCLKAYRASSLPIAKNTSFCAGGSRKGSCSGDSGGPLIRKGASAGQDVQTGIASFGPRPCGMAGVPNGFTRVSYYSKWIHANVCRFSSSSSSKPLTNSCTTGVKPTTKRPTGKPSVRNSSAKPVI